MDQVRWPEDAVWSADHTEGLGAPQVLALGGRGAQRTTSRRSVDAAAPPGGGGHTHSQCHWGQVGTWPRRPGRGQALTCPLPPACHTPSMPVYAVPHSERVVQGCSPKVVIGPCPILMPAPGALLCSAFLFEAQDRSRTLGRNVCLWPSLLGGLGQTLCLLVLGPGVQRQTTCPGSP